MDSIVIGAGLMFSYLLGMLIVVQVKQDASIGNFTWGGGVALLTLYALFSKGLFLPRQLLVTSLIVLWCLRLIVMLYARYRKGADPRFIAWQEQVGWYAVLFNFGWIVLLNGLMICVMALPSFAINLSSDSGLLWLDLVGVTMWILGFVCEAVADYQLFVFLRDPASKGKVMMSGLWYYSRHPNYFGEMVMWWGIFLLALSVPYGYFSIITPLTITILLRYITGVPWVEKVFDDNAAYQEYKKRTSAVMLWFPKKLR